MKERNFMAIRNDDNLSLFGQKLLRLMMEKNCDTPKALAKKLFEAQLVTVKTRGKDAFKNKNNAVGSIEKKIRTHLHADDAICLQGEFVNAYCQFFGCSADFLFGYTDIRTPDVQIREICDITGLSEDSVNCLKENKQGTNDDNVFSYTSWWSELLNGDSFYAIPMSWLDYARRIVEILDIDKHIEATEKASAEVELDLITKLLLDDDNQKSLRIIRRDKEDSILGAHHKMLSCIEHFMNQYADQWAEQQHLDFGEMYYRSELNKRKILKAHQKQE